MRRQDNRWSIRATERIPRESKSSRGQQKVRLMVMTKQSSEFSTLHLLSALKSRPQRPTRSFKSTVLTPAI
ncbi:hypothetical protein V5799_032379 [Amblyomma americanum]|uniref:Uncharacterized protein n=1 Tax=Amblyomma americanum TaxID=6943 RepID=A0AAQ4DRC0_AMBAM